MTGKREQVMRTLVDLNVWIENLRGMADGGGARDGGAPLQGRSGREEL